FVATPGGGVLQPRIVPAALWRDPCLRLVARSLLAAIYTRSHGSHAELEGIMINRPITRRTAAAGIVAALGSRAVRATDKSVTVGLSLSLTGAQAQSAKLVEYGAMMAFDEIN